MKAFLWRRQCAQVGLHTEDFVSRRFTGFRQVQQTDTMELNQ